MTSTTTTSTSTTTPATTSAPAESSLRPRPTSAAVASDGVEGGDPVTAGVVVGYDGSSSAAPALEWASAEAVRRGTTLTVLYAAEFGGMAAASGADLYGIADQIAEQGATRARAVPGAGALSITSRSRGGGATAALIAASQSADLVVVGNRGHGVVAGALLGSVAFSVSAGSHCPVVVVRSHTPDGAYPSIGVPPPGPGRAVIVGVDGSPGSDAAVAFAARAATDAGAVLHVVAAWKSPEISETGFAYRENQAFTDAAQRSARDAAKAGADVARSMSARIDVTEAVVQEPAWLALVQASAGAGLVVVGARGHGALSGLFLGSVSHAVIHSCLCPVAVVRHLP